MDRPYFIGPFQLLPGVQLGTLWNHWDCYFNIFFVEIQLKKENWKCFLGARVWAPKLVCWSPKQPEYVTDITPIFKKGNKLDSSNYKLISLFPNIIKILQKSRYSRLSKFLNKFNCLCRTFQEIFNKGVAKCTCKCR